MLPLKILPLKKCIIIFLDCSKAIRYKKTQSIEKKNGLKSADVLQLLWKVSVTGRPHGQCCKTGTLDSPGFRVLWGPYKAEPHNAWHLGAFQHMGAVTIMEMRPFLNIQYWESGFLTVSFAKRWLLEWLIANSQEERTDQNPREETVWEKRHKWDSRCHKIIKASSKKVSGSNPQMCLIQCRAWKGKGGAEGRNKYKGP